MYESLQTAIVTIVAAGAAWVVIKRVFVTVRPDRPAKCASCPSAQSAAPTPLAEHPRPLTFIKSR